MLFIDEGTVTRIRPLLVSLYAAALALTVCSVGWRLLENQVVPGIARGALRFALLCLGVAIVGTVRRQMRTTP
jgi:hypothetical protein